MQNIPTQISEQEPVIPQDPMLEQSNESGEQQAGQFTIDATAIEDGMKNKMNDKQVQNLDKVLKAGNKMLFGEETRYKIMDGFSADDGEKLSEELGQGALSMAKILVDKSGNTIPGDVIIPAGIILLARASQFLSESGTANVTDDVFEEAVHQFTVLTMDHFDPEFRSRVQGGQGQDVQQTGLPDQAEQQIGGGLLEKTEA